MAKVTNTSVEFSNVDRNIFAEYDSCTISGYNSGFMINGSTNNIINAYNSNVSIYGGSGNAITGTSNIIEAKDTDLTIAQGSYNVINGQFEENQGHSIAFYNGVGYNKISTYGSVQAFGADSLNLSLTAREASLFVAGEGNETLDGSYSTGSITVYAWKDNSNPSNFVASTGSGNDLLVAGTGNATFSGGAGDNYFVFVKDNDSGGRTVISDFMRSSGNRISLYNYGLSQESLNGLLVSSHNDSSGNAVLNLDNHQIIVEGVSINNLNSNNFIIG